MESFTKEQEQAYKIIELSVHLQRSIEILDDLNLLDHPLKNKKLASNLKAVYPSIDKQTKLYNEFYNANPLITQHFYEVVRENSRFIMSNNIIDQSKISNYLMAHEINSSSLEGIVTKILKSNQSK
mgnify:CR=1 FL=1